jgi:putative DNA primase/helicase
MTFLDFAQSCGLIIEHVEIDKWCRVPTVDHPRKRNGSYKFVGEVGWVQNFATMETPVFWKTDKPVKTDPEWLSRRKKIDEDLVANQSQAAAKAASILANSETLSHSYLTAKGFPEGRGFVWRGVLVVPMRIGSSLVGCQMIQQDGTKRFLKGQKTKGASLRIDAKGREIICEGYATALSIRRAMKLLGKRYSITVAFSAGNMIELAKSFRSLLVVADNDMAGVSAANKIGGRYWIGEEGQDFNDCEQSQGTAAAAESLARFL